MNGSINLFSRFADHTGRVFLAASILLSELSLPLLGVAYLLPVIRESWHTLKNGPKSPRM